MRAEAVTDAGAPVRITETERALNLIVLGAVSGEALTIKGLSLDAAARLVANGAPARFEARGEDSLITFSRPLTGAIAPVIRVEAPAA